MTYLREDGKTVVVISHRLSTLIKADTIFYLEKGKVVEQGSHEQLITNNGPYQKLWEKQLPETTLNLKTLI
jgi:ATP-binding cassette subfamily B protein